MPARLPLQRRPRRAEVARCYVGGALTVPVGSRRGYGGVRASHAYLIALRIFALKVKAETREDVSRSPLLQRKRGRKERGAMTPTSFL